MSNKMMNNLPPRHPLPSASSTQRAPPPPPKPPAADDAEKSLRAILELLPDMQRAFQHDVAGRAPGASSVVVDQKFGSLLMDLNRVYGEMKIDHSQHVPQQQQQHVAEPPREHRGPRETAPSSSSSSAPAAAPKPSTTRKTAPTAVSSSSVKKGPAQPPHVSSSRPKTPPPSSNVSTSSNTTTTKKRIASRALPHAMDAIGCNRHRGSTTTAGASSSSNSSVAAHPRRRPVSAVVAASANSATHEAAKHSVDGAAAAENKSEPTMSAEEELLVLRAKVERLAFVEQREQELKKMGFHSQQQEESAKAAFALRQEDQHQPLPHRPRTPPLVSPKKQKEDHDSFLMPAKAGADHLHPKPSSAWRRGVEDAAPEEIDQHQHSPSLFQSAAAAAAAEAAPPLATTSSSSSSSPQQKHAVRDKNETSFDWKYGSKQQHETIRRLSPSPGSRVREHNPAQQQENEEGDGSRLAEDHQMEETALQQYASQEQNTSSSDSLPPFLLIVDADHASFSVPLSRQHYGRSLFGACSLVDARQQLDPSSISSRSSSDLIFANYATLLCSTTDNVAAVPSRNERIFELNWSGTSSSSGSGSNQQEVVPPSLSRVVCGFGRLSEVSDFASHAHVQLLIFDNESNLSEMGVGDAAAEDDDEKYHRRRNGDSDDEDEPTATAPRSGSACGGGRGCVDSGLGANDAVVSLLHFMDRVAEEEEDDDANGSTIAAAAAAAAADRGHHSRLEQRRRNRNETRLLHSGDENDRRGDQQQDGGEDAATTRFSFEAPDDNNNSSDDDSAASNGGGGQDERTANNKNNNFFLFANGQQQQQHLSAAKRGGRSDTGKILALRNVAHMMSLLTRCASTALVASTPLLNMSSGGKNRTLASSSSQPVCVHQTCRFPSASLLVTHNVLSLLSQDKIASIPDSCRRNDFCFAFRLSSVVFEEPMNLHHVDISLVMNRSSSPRRQHQQQPTFFPLARVLPLLRCSSAEAEQEDVVFSFPDATGLACFKVPPTQHFSVRCTFVLRNTTNNNNLSNNMMRSSVSASHSVSQRQRNSSRSPDPVPSTGGVLEQQHQQQQPLRARDENNNSSSSSSVNRRRHNLPILLSPSREEGRITPAMATARTNDHLERRSAAAVTATAATTSFFIDVPAKDLMARRRRDGNWEWPGQIYGKATSVDGDSAVFSSSNSKLSASAMFHLGVYMQDADANSELKHRAEIRQRIQQQQQKLAASLPSETVSAAVAPVPAPSVAPAVTATKSDIAVAQPFEVHPPMSSEKNQPASSSSTSVPAAPAPAPAPASLVASAVPLRPKQEVEKEKEEEEEQKVAPTPTAAATVVLPPPTKTSSGITKRSPSPVQPPQPQQQSVAPPPAALPPPNHIIKNDTDDIDLTLTTTNSTDDDNAGSFDDFSVEGTNKPKQQEQVPTPAEKTAVNNDDAEHLLPPLSAFVSPPAAVPSPALPQKKEEGEEEKTVEAQPQAQPQPQPQPQVVAVAKKQPPVVVPVRKFAIVIKKDADSDEDSSDDDD